MFLRLLSLTLITVFSLAAMQPDLSKSLVQAPDQGSMKSVPSKIRLEMPKDIWPMMPSFITLREDQQEEIRERHTKELDYVLVITGWMENGFTWVAESAKIMHTVLFNQRVPTPEDFQGLHQTKIPGQCEGTLQTPLFYFRYNPKKQNLQFLACSKTLATPSEKQKKVATYLKANYEPNALKQADAQVALADRAYDRGNYPDVLRWTKHARTQTDNLRAQIQATLTAAATYCRQKNLKEAFALYKEIAEKELNIDPRSQMIARCKLAEFLVQDVAGVCEQDHPRAITLLSSVMGTDVSLTVKDEAIRLLTKLKAINSSLPISITRSFDFEQPLDNIAMEVDEDASEEYPIITEHEHKKFRA